MDAHLSGEDGAFVFCDSGGFALTLASAANCQECRRVSQGKSLALCFYCTGLLRSTILPKQFGRYAMLLAPFYRTSTVHRIEMWNPCFVRFYDSDILGASITHADGSTSTQGAHINASINAAENVRSEILALQSEHDATVKGLKAELKALESRYETLEKTIEMLTAKCESQGEAIESYRQELVGFINAHGALHTNYEGETFGLA